MEQGVELLDDTLRRNICFGLNGQATSISSEKLELVSRLAGVDRFWDRLTSGFETKIGENGVQLSGGERQRVGIARALIKDPTVLIFDEATSHLDTENERLIQEAIERASSGRTAIVVAHRLSTVKKMDTILVVDKGRIVGRGSHDELIGSCPTYQNLVRNCVNV